VNLGLRETLVLLFTISLVLVAEMFNSAIEATVDLVSAGTTIRSPSLRRHRGGRRPHCNDDRLVVGALLFIGAEPLGSHQDQCDGRRVSACRTRCD